VPLGFSNHTPGHSAVLGATTLGARIVEKHFTDNKNRVGPDHHFALNPKDWLEMVEHSYELRDSLGNGVKEIDADEMDTVITQRRAARVNRDIAKGKILNEDNIEFLRLCSPAAFLPLNYKQLLGAKLKTARVKGDYIRILDV